MKIGIDARLIHETGVGRYIQNLIRELALLDKTNEYVVFLRKQYEVPNDHWSARIADVPWHSVREQFEMPNIFAKEHLDLVHIPYHNPPIFYTGRMIVTIHDLTILHFDTGRATTLPLPLYQLKRLGYWLELAIGLRKAKKIIAVSQSTKQEIIDHFHIDPEKIIVTYEGTETMTSHTKRLIQEPYILYVGNAYPHKNLERLIEACNTKLVLATPDDYFSKRLKTPQNVLMIRSPSASQLANLYHHAQALVFPSLMEGFGLPGIEAMAIGTPVVCSDIPVFREVYGNATIMFDPNNPDDISRKIQEVLENEKLRKELIARGKKQAARYSWRTMAKETLEIYESSARI